MADGKWIAGLAPKMALGEAARTVLPARFRTVLNYLPLAGARAAADVEHVHQLRVATRRANAALRLFEPCLPGKRFRTFRKLLRALRRSAGEARDWDVFALMLTEAPPFKPEPARPALDFLTGYIASRRLEAQVHLAAAVPKEGEEFRTETEALLADPSVLESPAEPSSLGALAAVNVTDLVRELTGLTSPPPQEYEQLHQVRILGKHLRYSMEIFADCFAPSFKERLYPAAEDMQEILGRVTDAHVAAERLEAIRDHMQAFRPDEWRRFRKPIEELLRSRRQTFPRERKRFLAWLPRWEKLLAALPPASLLLSGALPRSRRSG
jgi:CHAD domain-containing protein